MTTKARMAVLVLAVAAAACAGKRGAAPGAGQGGASEGKAAAAAPDAAPAAAPAAPDVPAAPAPAAEAEEETLRPGTHPGAKGREYKLLRQDEVALDDAQREFFKGMTDGKTAEAVFKRIKAEGLAKHLPYLQRALKSTNREVRIQAVVMMGLFKDRSEVTIQQMRDALILDRDPDVRAMVARSFLGVPAEKATDVLIESLQQDPYEAARANAAWALGESRDRKAVPALVSALKDPDTFVRLKAVSALEKFKAREAVPALIETLGDKNPMVRENAHKVLVKITGTNRGTDPAKWKGVR